MKTSPAMLNSLSQAADAGKGMFNLRHSLQLTDCREATPYDQLNQVSVQLFGASLCFMAEKEVLLI
jgi:hypothetical protein